MAVLEPLSSSGHFGLLMMALSPLYSLSDASLCFALHVMKRVSVSKLKIWRWMR